MNKDKAKQLILACIDTYKPRDSKHLLRICKAYNIDDKLFKECLKELRQENRFGLGNNGNLVTIPIPESRFDENISKFKEEMAEPIPEKELKKITKEMTIDDLKDRLGLTVKKDDSNKSITFLCMLSAYSENNQFNIKYSAPSATGKSYIALELSDLFPAEDVISIGYASPTSFFHQSGNWDKERKAIINDFERKILIFIDQPHDVLLQRLRPFLSHDKKEIALKITDRTEKYGMRTKTALLRGYSSVIFCTGALKINEQEATRNFLLSPETTEEKIRESIYLKALKRGNRLAYNEMLDKDEKRKLLKQRIILIRDAKINEIIIPDFEDKVVKRFIENTNRLKPRHTRDIDRIISLIGASALFNLWHRKRDETNNIYANQEDIDNGFNIWDSIAECQELNIPPYIWNIFNEVIKPAYNELNEDDKKIGLDRKDIKKKHYEVYGRPINDESLRKEILPELESAGLIIQETSAIDKREKVVKVV